MLVMEAPFLLSWAALFGRIRASGTPLASLQLCCQSKKTKGLPRSFGMTRSSDPAEDLDLRRSNLRRRRLGEGAAGSPGDSTAAMAALASEAGHILLCHAHECLHLFSQGLYRR